MKITLNMMLVKLQQSHPDLNLTSYFDWSTGSIDGIRMYTTKNIQQKSNFYMSAGN